MTFEEIQCIANLTAKFIGLRERPAIRIVKGKLKGNVMARAFYTLGYIEISDAIFDYRDSIFLHYMIIHEVCHFAPNCGNHKKIFIEVETKALDFWGIGIIRKTVYPKRLFRKLSTVS